jgi:Tfp pilus assembly protein PilX
MTGRLERESGFALIVTMMLMLFALGIGVALVARADSQSNLSGHERTREASFNLAEAALNAEALQLSRSWPGATATSSPTSCDPSSTDTACPLPAALGNAYNGTDYASSCLTTTGTPLWQTTVRDNVTGEQYWTSAIDSRAAYDLNSDGVVWARATASVQCDKVSVVSLVSRSSVPMSFPNSVLTSNWFQTANQGRKVIIDTLGTYASPPRPASQPGAVSLRCQNVTGTCANYQTSKGQVQPPTVQTNSTAPTSALTPTQLQSLERQATAAGTLYTCPASGANLSSVNGAPVVITGSAVAPCNVSVGGGTVNSATSPGVLVIEYGTLTMTGNSYFYGLVYCVNKQASSGIVLGIQANATVQGSVAIDGSGGLSAGSSKTNLIYDSRAPALVRGESGAVMNKNTFRVLPPSTP